jgi:hypothetical protein
MIAPFLRTRVRHKQCCRSNPVFAFDNSGWRTLSFSSHHHHRGCPILSGRRRPVRRTERVGTTNADKPGAPRLWGRGDDRIRRTYFPFTLQGGWRALSFSSRHHQIGCPILSGRRRPVRRTERVGTTNADKPGAPRLWGPGRPIAGNYAPPAHNTNSNQTFTRELDEPQCEPNARE